jgi:Rad3-related DNA helicases
MEAKVLLKISIQNLIEFSIQSGDLGTGFFSASRAVEGTKGHQALRKRIKENLPEDSVYYEEVPVSYLLEGSIMDLEISGRIDGIIEDSSGITVHEIKTTKYPVNTIERNYNPQHWTQALSYAFMYSYANRLEKVDIHLTYYNPDDRSEKSFNQSCNMEELESFFIPLAQSFIEWQELLLGWHKVRNDSILEMTFPYGSYRKGQRELAGGVYKCIKNGSMLFAQAPTGTGKTMATLFPAIKAMGEGSISKIFYLTAKSTTRAIAEKAINDMRCNGLRIKSITITAKEKTCLNGSFNCDPEVCSYAAGYYERVRNALRDAFRLDCMDRMLIEETAAIHNICPFELSLDLSLWCDVIICDYNYLFDPRVNLKRFFTNRKENYCFLIDEAHNLIDRARDMFSAEIYKKDIFELKKAVKAEIPELYNITDQIYKYMLNIGKEISDDVDEQGKNSLIFKKDPPHELASLLEKFTIRAESIISNGPPVSFQEEFLDAYFNFLNYVKINELFDDKYMTYYEKSSRDLKIKLFCIDPSKLLREAMDKGKASILFSATLSPAGYFTHMLGGDENTRFIALPSPFVKENLCVYINDIISTRFKARHTSYDIIAENILATAAGKVGNYLVFFPSFEYLREVYVRFQGIQNGIRTLYQVSGMSEAAREEFLSGFEHVGETSLVGFTVMGGVFGEGIDLTGDRLSGAIVVGVGLPLVCNERNLIRNYFDEQSCNGFQYAYMYPGMNKVLQAAGRVIRTETDRGVIVLLDERFSNYSYNELLPPEWQPLSKASDGFILDEVLQDFWNS